MPMVVPIFLAMILGASVNTIECVWVEEGDTCLRDDDPHECVVLLGGDVVAAPLL